MTSLWVIPLGLLIGVALGSLGAGGSILTIPALVYVLGLSAHQALAGSLIIVGFTALGGALGHHREGNVRWWRGVGFGVLGVLGSTLGTRLSAGIRDAPLMLAFSGLMFVVAFVMWRRSARRGSAPEPSATRGRADDHFGARQVVVLLLTATGVGMITGFFGVGGGFVVVPALVLALGLPMTEAVGTSLVVIAINCVSALTARLAIGIDVPWGVVGPFAVVAVVGSLAGARLVRGVDQRTLTRVFASMLVLVAAYTVVRTLPTL